MQKRLNKKHNEILKKQTLFLLSQKLNLNRHQFVYVSFPTEILFSDLISHCMIYVNNTRKNL